MTFFPALKLLAILILIGSAACSLDFLFYPYCFLGLSGMISGKMISGKNLAAIPAQKWRHHMAVLIPLILMIILAAISLFWSLQADRVISKSPRLILLFLLTPGVFIAAKDLIHHHRSALHACIMISLAFGALYMFTEWYFNFPIYRLVNQIDATQPTHNHLLNRQIVIYVMLSMVFWALPPQDQQKTVFGIDLPRLISFCITLMITLFSHSQTAQLGLLLWVALFTFNAVRPELSRRAIQIFSLLIVLSPLPLSYVLKHSGLMLNENFPFSFRHRIETWGFLFQKWLEKPFFGWGIGASHQFPSDGRVSLFQPQEASLVPFHPHNGGLQIIFELGIIGAALWITFWLALQSRLLAPDNTAMPAQQKTLSAVAVSVILFMLHTEHGLLQIWWLTALCFTLAFLYDYQKQS